MKFFHRGDFGEFYLLYGDAMYVQVWEDWTNVINYKKYNWSTFHLFHCVFDVDRNFTKMFTFEFGILGFNIRIVTSSVSENESKELEKNLSKIFSKKQYENKSTKNRGVNKSKAGGKKKTSRV